MALESANEPRLKYAELLLRKGMQEEARAQLEELLRDDPECARAHYVLAVVLASEGSPQEAVPHFQQAFRLVPDDFKALNALGVAYRQLGKIEEAMACYRQALRMHPPFEDARINLSLQLKEQGRLSEAERELTEAVGIEPGSVRLAYNLANVLHLQGRSVDAAAWYRRVLRLDPEHLAARQNLLFALHYSPRFTDRQIFAEHLKASRMKIFRPGRHVSTALIAYPSGRRVRLGYLSPDFRDHAVARFIEPVLAHHDRGRFEIFCYANLSGPDETTARLRNLAEHWRDIYGMSEDKAAYLIEADGIDILVDLAGHTSGNRLPLFARRVAPLQVTWIGYPDTTGLSQMDYRITDLLADPPGRERFHTERLIRLPRVFSCYLPPQATSEVGPPPSDSTGRITFGSFNNLAKVTPETIALWGRVLRAVQGSRMVVKCRPLSDPEVRVRIMSCFADAGIEPGRVDLHGGDGETRSHLAQYRRVDIALDTFPYNGTTTTCEALWMGVPVVTLAGARHASRTGASILANCGLDWLVANDPEAFVSIAGGLAAAPDRLRELRQGLRKRFRESAVMDGAGVTRELEEALLGVLRERSELCGD